jgi:hypothetical protein
LHGFACEPPIDGLRAGSLPSQGEAEKEGRTAVRPYGREGEGREPRDVGGEMGSLDSAVTQSKEASPQSRVVVMNLLGAFAP